MRRSVSAALVAALAVPALAVPSPAGSVVIRDDVAEAAGGIGSYYDSGNGYPATAFIGMGCTGTLINARTIVTAAHCFGSQQAADAAAGGTSVSFQPIAGLPEAFASSVLVHPGYSDDSFAWRDVAIITLDRPITSITPIPLARSVSPDGQQVTIVGYGLAAVASNPGATVDDERRRVATNSLNFAGPASGLPGDATEGGARLLHDQPVLAVDVDHVPFDEDYNALADAVARALEGGGAPGDSGGPLYLTLPDGRLMLVGILTGGLLPSNVEDADFAINHSLLLGYGGITLWQSVPYFYDWIAANSPLRWTAAEAGDGVWSSAAHWSGGEVPNNSSGYVAGGGARYFDVTLNQPGTTRLDVDATIDSLFVEHPDAVLDIAEPYRLTAEIGTTLSDGRLRVDGLLDSPWLRIAGGTLEGSGRIAALQGVRQSGGTVSPGGVGAIGTLSIDGSFVQSGGVLLSELSGGQTDLLSVTGTASLGGELQIGLLDGVPRTGSVYTVATADGGLATDLEDPAAIGAVTFSLAARDDAITVAVGRRSFETLATDENQLALAGVLDEARAQGLFGNDFFDSLDPLPAPQMAQAFDQLGGAPTTAGRTAQAISAQFLGAASQRLAALRAGDGALGADNATALRMLMTPDPAASVLLTAGADPTEEQLMTRPRLSGPTDAMGSAVSHGPVFALGRDSGVGGGTESLPLGIWIQPYGLWASRSGESSGDRYDTTVGGVAAGLDYRLSGSGRNDGLLVGLSFGFAQADTYYDDVSSETRQRSYQAGLYGGWWSGPWSLDAGVGASLNRYETRRDIAFGSVDSTAEASYDGWDYSGYLEGRYRHEVAVGGPGLLEITPMAGLQALRLSTDSYSEEGAGGLALSVGSDRVTSLRSSLGAALAYPLELEDGTLLRPEVRARWSHEFADTGTAVDARFAAGGASFAVAAEELGRDAALLGIGLEAQLNPALSLSLGYDSQIQTDYTVHAVTGSLRWSF